MTIRIMNYGISTWFQIKSLKCACCVVWKAAFLQPLKTMREEREKQLTNLHFFFIRSAETNSKRNICSSLYTWHKSHEKRFLFVELPPNHHHNSMQHNLIFNKTTVINQWVNWCWSQRIYIASESRQNWRNFECEFFATFVCGDDGLFAFHTYCYWFLINCDKQCAAIDVNWRTLFFVDIEYCYCVHTCPSDTRSAAIESKSK